MIIAYICLFFLSYFDSESHIGGPSPAGVVVVAVPRAWRLMRSRRPGGLGPGFGARKSITVLHVN